MARISHHVPLEPVDTGQRPCPRGRHVLRSRASEASPDRADATAAAASPVSLAGLHSEPSRARQVTVGARLRIRAPRPDEQGDHTCHRSPPMNAPSPAGTAIKPNVTSSRIRASPSPRVLGAGPGSGQLSPVGRESASSASTPAASGLLQVRTPTSRSESQESIARAEAERYEVDHLVSVCRDDPRRARGLASLERVLQRVVDAFLGLTVRPHIGAASSPAQTARAPPAGLEGDRGRCSWSARPPARSRRAGCGERLPGDEPNNEAGSASAFPRSAPLSSFARPKQKQSGSRCARVLGDPVRLRRAPGRRRVQTDRVQRRDGQQSSARRLRGASPRARAQARRPPFSALEERAWTASGTGLPRTDALDRMSPRW